MEDVGYGINTSHPRDRRGSERQLHGSVPRNGPRTFAGNRHDPVQSDVAHSLARRVAIQGTPGP
jgi:hypothetical protein